MPRASLKTGPGHTAEVIAAKELFLLNYRDRGIVRRACEAAGIGRSTYYQWLAADPDFAAACAEAGEDATDLLYDEALRRGRDGVRKLMVSMGRPVFWQGKPVYEQEYSDNLLNRTLARRDPMWRERQQVEHTGNVEVRQHVTFYMPVPLEPPPEAFDE